MAAAPQRRLACWPPAKPSNGRHVRHVALLAFAWPAAGCQPRFQLPQAPRQVLDLNGAALPDTCFNSSKGHVFVIGDWGGLTPRVGAAPVPADHRSKKFPSRSRPFVVGVDDCAQQRVARQMLLRALRSQPDYMINVGDNFYWGGIRAKCGLPAFQRDETAQWGPIFEDVYRGPGIDGVQWLGVLGNHDYGGFTFTMAWDQAIRYTWGSSTSTGRWVTPAQYWRSSVHYLGFSVDYFFVDSNVFDAFEPDVSMGHNICGRLHNPTSASCQPHGPTSVCDCTAWFARLWDEQMQWLDVHLANSSAYWQIVVTHFPPTWGQQDWVRLSRAHGIDLIITGHMHRQEVLGAWAPGNMLESTAWVVSGGGGGITSEGGPAPNGEDDAYGFMDLELSHDAIIIHAVSHGGQERSTTVVKPRWPDANFASWAKRQPSAPRAKCEEHKEAGGRNTNGHGHEHHRRDFLQWLLSGKRHEAAE